VLDTLLGWALRALLIAIGAGAALALVRWVYAAWQEKRERWPVRLALGMVLLATIYGVGHARMLVQREQLEAGRMRYARFGDPRLTERTRAEVRGWILDCTGQDQHALARYALSNGEVQRVYPLGEAGANLIGGGAGAEVRDYTVERLYADHLRAPRSLREMGELHPAGSDLQLTLCSDATRQAWQLLRGTGRPGAVVVQDVNTGGVVAYAATGRPEQAPLGIKRYAPPGSVFKLALAALWWESGLPDTRMDCPAEIQVTPRATIANSGRVAHGTMMVPHEMLVPSCNTAAVQMALLMRERLGTDAFVNAYRSYGFLPYTGNAPRDSVSDFWSTESARWARRMSPPSSRIRIGEKTGRAEWAQLSIGQGPVDVTVVGVSRFMQAIGNGGVMLPPTIEQRRARRPPDGDRVMSRETAAKLQRAMLDVVDSPRGTARSIAQVAAALPGDIGGKTGTAQVRGAPDDGWFAGLVFGPEGRPTHSVVVYLQGGGPGGGQPAAIAAGLARTLLRREAAT
jgi:cell division protein FtsI/penicillin-binding protein 2